VLPLRQAFTADELTTAKSRVEHVERLQTTVGELWRQVRWTADVIARARDRTRHNGLIRLRALFVDIGQTMEQPVAADEVDDSCRSSNMSSDTGRNYLSSTMKNVEQTRTPHEDRSSSRTLTC